MIKSVLVCLTVVAAFIVGATAQEDPKQPRPSDIEEKVWVRLVQMQITARDRHGNPITDLKAEEIVVKDRGDKMEVAFLKPFVDPDSKDDGSLPDVRLYLEAPDTWKPATTSKDREPAYQILFIDLEHDPLTRRPDAARDTVRFVIERLRPGTRVAVFSYNGIVNQESTFITDRAAIADAIQAAYSRQPRPHLELKMRVRQLVSSIKDCVNDASGAFVASGDERCLKDAALEYADELRPEAKDFLAALVNVVRFAGGLEGESSVLAVSHGVSVEPTLEIAEAVRAVMGNTEQVNRMIMYLGFGEGARAEMDRLLQLAVRNEVALSFVDRSLQPSGDIGASLGTPNQPGVRPIETAFQAAQNDLKEIAAATGGSFIATPNVFDGLSEVQDMERGTYTLGYYVERYLNPKKLSKVSVSSKRRGVKLGHRRGYYKKPAFDDILGEIKLGVPTAPSAGFEPVEGAVHLPFALAVDSKNIGYESTDPPGAVSAQFTVHLRLTTETGRVLADSYHFLNHGYSQAIWDKGDVAPVTLTGWVEAPPGKYRLAALFTNPKNGRRGELSGEIEIRSPQAAQR